MPRDLFFLEPFRILWMLIIPIAMGLLFYGYKKREALLEELMGYVAQNLYQRSPFYSLLKGVMISCALAFAVIALMEPMGNGHRKSLQGKTPLDLYLLIDRSYSMDVKDAKNNLSRLDRAKQIADRLLDDLRGEAIALYGFTDYAELLVPLTYDSYFVRLVLRDLSSTAGGRYGTDFEGVLKQVGEDLSQNPYGNPSLILILSDGEDTKWEGEGGAPLSSVHFGKTAIAAVIIGSASGGVIPGIEVKGKPVISKAMTERLSAVTQGKLFEDAPDLIEKLLGLMDQVDQESYVSQSKEVAYDDYFQYPLFASLICFLLAWILPVHRFWILLLCTLPMNAEVWLQDRMDYNASIQSLQAGKGEDAEEFLMAISPQAYASPIFRSRIAINYAESALKIGQNPLKIQNGLLVLRFMQLLPCDPLNLCHPELQNSLLNEVQNALAEKQEPLFSQREEIAQVKKLLESADFPESLRPSYEDYLHGLSKDGGALNDLPLIHFGAMMPSHEVLDRLNILLSYSSNPYVKELKLEKGQEAQQLLRLELKLLASHSPLNAHEAISDLVNAASVASFLQLIGGGDEARFEMISLYEERIALLHQYQERSFRSGKCQCYPWNEVMPLLALGGGYLKQAANNDTQIVRYDFLNGAHNAFRKALAKLHEDQGEKKSDRQAEQELQEMQQLDRPNVLKRSLAPLEGGKPW